MLLHAKIQRIFYYAFCGRNHATTLNKIRRDKYVMSRPTANEMQDLDADTVNAKTHGNLVGLANELDRLGDDLSDSNVKAAINSISYMVGGGLIGYTVGALLDNLEHLVNLL